MSIISIMQNFAEQNGLSFDKQTYTIYGKFNGHTVSLQKANEGNFLTLPSV